MATAEEAPGGGRLRGRVALVTGGGSGIGRAVVDRYLQEGARVGVLERDHERASELAENGGDCVVATVGDVRDPAAHETATRRVLDSFGQLDIYVGNAGRYDYGASVTALPAAELRAGFTELFEINVLGYLLGVRAALPPLRAASGCIILTVSSSGSYAGGGGALYVSSKHAVVGLIRQLACELAPDIRVNGVAPGATHTGLAGLTAFRSAQRNLDEEESLLAAMARGIPLGFVSEPADHTGLYVLLADQADSRFLTAAVLPSDGGLEVRGSRASRSGRGRQP